MSKILKTPEAVLSYPSLFTPRAMNEGDPPKYEATFVFAPGTDLTEIKKAINEVGMEKWGDKFPEMVRKGKVRLPIRTEWEEKGYPEDSVFFAARRHAEKDGRPLPPPGVVSVYPDEHDPTKPALITDPSKVYAGCIVKGLVSVFAYTKPNPGITFGLEGIQKIRDGDRLDGRVNPQSVFEVDESAFANLDAALAADEPEGDDVTPDEAEDILSLLGG